LGFANGSRDIAVNDLCQAKPSLIRMHVEGLGLDTGRVHSRPFQVLLPQLGVRRLVGLLRYGLDGIGAIDGLLGAGYMSKPADNVSLGGVDA
jgi:hypothetical protein